MKKNKNSDSTVSEPRIVTAPVEATEESSGIPLRGYMTDFVRKPVTQADTAADSRRMADRLW